jgi:argininosuccinate synthase
MKRIVLAYSGGLETTAAIPWLAETYGAEVVTVTLDVGQVIDAREEFVRGFVLPALRTGTFAPDREFAGIAVSRPLIAKRLVEIAQMESASAVAHGCRCDAPGRRMFESAIQAADPSLSIIAPVCDSRMSDVALAEYARERNIAVPTGTSNPDVDANVWGRVMRGASAPGAYKLTRAIPDTPDAAAYVNIEFAAGVPVRANGVEMPLIDMIESIETIAGAHGVGRIAAPGGSIAESPAGVVLHAACAELSKTSAAGDHADAGRPVSGVVRVKLFKGSCEATALEPVV